MLAELRAEKAAELDGCYTRVIDKAMAEILDRLENGDPYVVGGEVKRKPVSARDLALVAAISYDKRALARGQTPTPQDESVSYTTQDVLEWVRERALKAPPLS